MVVSLHFVDKQRRVNDAIMKQDMANSSSKPAMHDANSRKKSRDFFHISSFIVSNLPYTKLTNLSFLLTPSEQLCIGPQHPVQLFCGAHSFISYPIHTNSMIIINLIKQVYWNQYTKSKQKVMYKISIYTIKNENIAILETIFKTYNFSTIQGTYFAKRN